MNDLALALVEGKIRQAREQFLEPPLPVDDVGHMRRIGAWRRWDGSCAELVRALAGAEAAADFDQVQATAAPVNDPDRLIAVGANLVNVISRKIGWLEEFKRRLETRETLREIRG